MKGGSYHPITGEFPHSWRRTALGSAYEFTVLTRLYMTKSRSICELRKLQRRTDFRVSTSVRLVAPSTHTNRLTRCSTVESGGAALPYQAEVFPDKEHFGRIFYNMANLSAAAIPSVVASIADRSAVLTTIVFA